MKISMWMLCDDLSDSVYDHNLGETAETRRVEGLLPFLPDEAMAEDHVYIVQSSDMAKIPLNEEHLLVICGNLDAIDPDCTCQYIRLHPEISTGTALKLVLNAFMKYNTWYDKLQQTLIGSPDLTRICEIGNELLENYITLFDPEHILIAYAALPPTMIGTVLEKKRGPYYALTDSAYKAMVNRPEHRDDIRAEHAALYFDTARQIRILYANVGPGRFECRLCIGEEKRSFKRSDAQLCEILAQVLLIAFQGNHLYGTTTKTNLRDILHNILKEQSVDDIMLEQNLNVWQWSRHDRFICMEIEKLNSDRKFLSSDRYICSRIEELLTDACAFMSNGSIICVARLLADDSPEQDMQCLGEFLQDSIFVVGVSDEFDDIMDIGSYHMEACIAVQLGRSKRPTDWYHMFSNYALLHFFQHGTSVLPAIYYCDRNVRNLMKICDTKVDYSETLRVYLENDRNLLLTAKTLHIHRTTLFYRLNRLNEMIDGNLDNPAVRLRILFSFELIEMDKHPEKFMKARSLARDETYSGSKNHIIATDS